MNFVMNGLLHVSECRKMQPARAEKFPRTIRILNVWTSLRVWFWIILINVYINCFLGIQLDSKWFVLMHLILRVLSNTLLPWQMVLVAFYSNFVTWIMANSILKMSASVFGSFSELDLLLLSVYCWTGCGELMVFNADFSETVLIKQLMHFFL